MKRLVSLFLLLSLLAALIAGCGSSGDDTSSSAGEETTTAEAGETVSETGESEGSGVEGQLIAISSLSQSLPFVAVMVEGMEAVAHEAGAEVVVADAQAKADKQTADIQDLLSQEPDGVIIIPKDSQVGVGQVESIAARGIPVVSAGVQVGDPLERPLKDVYPALNALVTQDEPLAGEQAAEMVEEVLPEGGDIAIIEGAPGQAENKTRVIKFLKRLEASGKGYPVVGKQPGNWIAADGQAACANLLTANPEIKLFYTLSDDMAVGCANAIKASNSEAKIVSIGGFKQALDPIKSGTSPIVGTVCYQPRVMGEVATEKLIEVMEGADIQAEFVSYPTFGVTKDTTDKCKSQV